MFCVFFLGCPIAISILNRSDAAPVVCLSQTQTRYFGRDYVPWLALALALHWHTCLLNLFAGGGFCPRASFFPAGFEAMPSPSHVLVATITTFLGDTVGSKMGSRDTLSTPFSSKREHKQILAALPYQEQKIGDFWPRALVVAVRLLEIRAAVCVVNRNRVWSLEDKSAWGRSTPVGMHLENERLQNSLKWPLIKAAHTRP